MQTHNLCLHSQNSAQTLTVVAMLRFCQRLNCEGRDKTKSIITKLGGVKFKKKGVNFLMNVLYAILMKFVKWGQIGNAVHFIQIQVYNTLFLKELAVSRWPSVTIFKFTGTPWLFFLFSQSLDPLNCSVLEYLFSLKSTLQLWAGASFSLILGMRYFQKEHSLVR